MGTTKTKVHIFMNDPKDIAYTLRKIAGDIERSPPTFCIYAGGQPNIVGFYSVSIEVEDEQPLKTNHQHLKKIAAIYKKNSIGARKRQRKKKIN